MEGDVGVFVWAGVVVMANLSTGPKSMREVFDALPGVLLGHDWLVSEVEVYPDWGKGDGPVWLTGAELDDLLATEPCQFVWAVFSGVPVGYRVGLEVVPHAVKNHSFYRGSPRPQLPGAELEIVCIDGGSCLLIGLSEELAAGFRSAFPGEVDDLDEENRNRSLPDEWFD